MSELVDVRVVQETEDVPGAFLWRGRLYVVREVLGHWRERGEWWSTAAARALHGENGELVVRPSVSRPRSFTVWADGPIGVPSGESPGGVPGEVPEGGVNDEGAGQEGRPGEFLHDSECEVWRVEASTGRAFGNGVYDLSRTSVPTAASGAWRLLQVAD